MVFAGIWAARLDPDTDIWQRTCSIVTATAEGVISSIHDRMPVSLPREAWDPWLDRELHDPNQVMGVLDSIDPEEIMEHPVSNRVNSVKNNGPELQDRAEPDTLF